MWVQHIFFSKVEALKLSLNPSLQLARSPHNAFHFHLQYPQWCRWPLSCREHQSSPSRPLLKEPSALQCGRTQTSTLLLRQEGLFVSHVFILHSSFLRTPGFTQSNKAQPETHFSRLPCSWSWPHATGPLTRECRPVDVSWKSFVSLKETYQSRWRPSLLILAVNANVTRSSPHRLSMAVKNDRKSPPPRWQYLAVAESVPAIILSPDFLLRQRRGNLYLFDPPCTSSISCSPCGWPRLWLIPI